MVLSVPTPPSPIPNDDYDHSFDPDVTFPHDHGFNHDDPGLLDFEFGNNDIEELGNDDDLGPLELDNSDARLQRTFPLLSASPTSSECSVVSQLPGPHSPRLRREYHPHLTGM
jgi:hypothetical protein